LADESQCFFHGCGRHTCSLNNAPVRANSAVSQARDEAGFAREFATSGSSVPENDEGSVEKTGLYSTVVTRMVTLNLMGSLRPWALAGLLEQQETSVILLMP